MFSDIVSRLSGSCSIRFTFGVGGPGTLWIGCGNSVPLAGIELQFAGCAVYSIVSKLTDRPIFRLLSSLPPSVCVYSDLARAMIPSAMEEISVVVVNVRKCEKKR